MFQHNATFGELKVGDEFVRQSDERLYLTKHDPMPYHTIVLNACGYDDQQICRHAAVPDDEPVIYLF